MCKCLKNFNKHCLKGKRHSFRLFIAHFIIIKDTLAETVGVTDGRTDR